MKSLTYVKVYTVLHSVTSHISSLTLLLEDLVHATHAAC